ncbi:peroxiredoxin family protein [Halosimplex sp. J119]
MSLDGEQAPEFELPSTAGDTIALADGLEDGPAVVLINRGYWCSFCAEQLQTFSEIERDLWFYDDLSVLPVVPDPLVKVTQMRDRYDLSIQLLADPDGTVADRYSGTEETEHGLTGKAATYVLDEDGTVRYEQVSENPADRTYGNWVRKFVRNDFEPPFEG